MRMLRDRVDPDTRPHPGGGSHLTRRRAIARGGGGAIAAGTALAACGQAGGSGGGGDAAGGGPQAARVALTAYFGVQSDQLQGFDPQIARAYAAERPNVEVQLLPQPPGGEAGMREKLAAMMAGGTPPDVWEYATIAETMVTLDWLLPLDEYLRKASFDSGAYAKGLYEHTARFQGKTWLVPYGHGGNTMVLALNPQLFAAAGVPLPGATPNSTWSWNEFAETMQRVTRRQGDAVSQIGLANAGWFGSYPQLWQTDWVNADLKTVVCDGPEMVECYSRFFDLVNRHRVLPRPGELESALGVKTPLEAFTAGKAAATMVAPASVRTFTEPKLVELSLAPIPRAKVSTPDVNWHSFGLIKGTKQADAGFAFARWLTDEARWSRFVRKIPAQAQLQPPFLKELFKDFAAPRLEAITGALAAAVPQTRLFRLTAYPQVSVAIIEAFNRDLWTGQGDPGTVLKALKGQLQGIVNT